MKIAIVGSRNYPNRRHVIDYVNSLPQDTVIVSGGAIGVDSWAEAAARNRGMDTMIFKPDWKRFGRSAGYRRNYTIIEAADKVIAFTTGSKGTANSIEIAQRLDKELEVYSEETR